MPPEPELQVETFIICLDTPPVLTSSTDGEGIDTPLVRSSIDFTSGSVPEQRPVRLQLYFCRSVRSTAAFHVRSPRSRLEQGFAREAMGSVAGYRDCDSDLCIERSYDA